MKYKRYILIFAITACTFLAFFPFVKENICEKKADIVQEEQKEEITYRTPAKAENKSSAHKSASYIKSFQVFKTIDTSKDTTKYAENAIFEYLADTANMSVEKYLEKLKEGGLKAHACGFEVDLNNDGINEIIGIHSYLCASITCTGEILQKKNGKWVNIGYIEYGPGSIIEILKNKTNGYYDIRTISNRFCGGTFDTPCYPEIKRFKDNEYYYTIYAEEILIDKQKLQ